MFSVIYRIRSREIFFFSALSSSLAFSSGGVVLLCINAWIIQHHKQNQIEFKQHLQNRRGQANHFEVFESSVDSLEPKDYYAAVVNSPLFIEGRKPIAVADSLDNSNVLDLKLTGITQGPSELIALLQDGKKNHFRLRKGDIIFGWEIIDVRSEWIELSNQGQLHELRLVEPTLPPQASSIPNETTHDYPEEQFKDPQQLPDLN